LELKIDLTKSLQENASNYFEKSKEAKAKISKIEELIEKTKKEKEKLALEKPLSKKAIKKRKLEWFEKFKWCYSSDGFLMLAGRDIKTNEILLKKYMEKNDLYFHAEIQGAAHCILKNGINASEETLKETAEFAAINSKAWQLKFASIDVYSVKPEQVSKSAPSGESIKSGAFMIYGERKWFKNVSLEFAIGIQKINDGFRIISGPLKAIKKHALVFVQVFQGNQKKSFVAKKLKQFFEEKTNETLDLDEIMRMLPENIEVKI